MDASGMKLKYKDGRAEGFSWTKQRRKEYLIQRIENDKAELAELEKK